MKKRQLHHFATGVSAEREGFEPSLPLRVNQFSRLTHSTTLPPLHDGILYTTPPDDVKAGFGECSGCQIAMHADPQPVEPPGEYDRVTAYHEAGHAVVALALGRPIHRVSVLPNQELLGKCEFRKGMSRPADDWVETEILIALAGMVAEARYTGTYDRLAAARDLSYARKLSLQRATERQLERFEKRMRSKVEHILAGEALWRAVEAVAEQLVCLGAISGRAARHLYEQAVRTGQ